MNTIRIRIRSKITIRPNTGGVVIGRGWGWSGGEGAWVEEGL